MVRDFTRFYPERTGGEVVELNAELEQKFDFLFEKLNVADTLQIAREYAPRSKGTDELPKFNAQTGGKPRNQNRSTDHLTIRWSRT